MKQLLAGGFMAAALAVGCGGGDNSGTSSALTNGGASGTGGSGGANGGSGGSTGATDNTVKTGGLGRPCESSTDCPSTMTCRVDTQEYIADQQCTAPCSADADCTSQFGEYSMCIGANICVTKCVVQSDCPAKTQCNTAGWCERTGPGSGVPYCTGTALPCSTLSDTQCYGTLGCTANLGDCHGVSDSCYSQFDSFSCNGVQGCYWSSSSSSCSGSSDSCSSMFGEFSCTSQPGCSWTPPSCSGVPESCDQIPTSLCSSQAGCTLAQ